MQCAEHCKAEGCAGCEPHTLDLADGPAVTRWAEDCVRKHGDVSVLVNNAGVFGPAGEGQGPLAGEEGTARLGSTSHLGQQHNS